MVESEQGRQSGKVAAPPVDVRRVTATSSSASQSQPQHTGWDGRLEYGGTDEFCAHHGMEASKGG